MKPSLKANALAEMMASFGSCGLPGVLHYCLLPLIKYLVSQLLAAQQRLDHTGSAGQDRGKKVEEKKKGVGEGGMSYVKAAVLAAVSAFLLCVLQCLLYLLLSISWWFSQFTLC